MIEFNKSSISISIPKVDGLELKAATKSDLENLRIWKNSQKQFFFHQVDISAQQQSEWYAAYEKRPYDLLLMTIFRGKVFGCMGIRWLDGYWDIYNVILGDASFGKRGLMSNAFKALLDYALDLKFASITLQVLKHNPAVEWYKKNGFIIVEDYNSHFIMKFDSIK
jgi:RimJ/RimL family protein N-acetyltransferase